MPVANLEELESSSDWIATFSFKDNENRKRVLMKHPVGEGLFWREVGPAGLPWQWGITSLYEGDSFLLDIVEAGVLSRDSGTYPWELERVTVEPPDKTAEIQAEATKLIGLSD